MARFVPVAATLVVAFVLLALGAMADALGMQRNLPDRYEVWCAQHASDVRAASTVLGMDETEPASWARSCQAAFDGR